MYFSTNKFTHLIILILIIFLEGFVTISLEIVVIRQLIPFVGSNVIVTSLIIGIFLLFLALGYRQGGRITGNYAAVLKRNFIWAAFGLGIGTSYLFVTLYFVSMQRWVSHYVLVNLGIYLLVVMAPIVYILGQTVPITTNLFTDRKTVGAISGTVLYVSTLGSFLGAVFTGLVLFTFLGVAWTILINFIILVGLIVSLCRPVRDDAMRLLILGIGFIGIYYINVTAERFLFLHTNHYANYSVRDEVRLASGEQGRALIVNNSLASFIAADGSVAPYVETMRTILFDDLNMTGKTILVVGAGGFTFSKEGTHDNTVIYLDIDPDIEAVAQSNFIDTINGEFIAADARLYLASTDASFDVIISDAFSNQSSIPTYLLTQEYMQTVHQRLTDDGIALFNMIATPFLDDAYAKRVDNTIRSVFTSCMSIPLQYHAAVTNIIYVCKKSPYENDIMIYTDNLNQADWDFFWMR